MNIKICLLYASAALLGTVFVTAGVHFTHKHETEKKDSYNECIESGSHDKFECYDLIYKN